MMYYSRPTMLGVLGVCFLGLLLCLPNFMRAPSPKLPWHQIHLGWICVAAPISCFDSISKVLSMIDCKV